MEKRTVAALVLALLVIGVVLPAAQAAPVNINPKEIGKALLDGISTFFSWYKVDHFEIDPTTGEYIKPVYNEQFKKQRQVSNGVMLFFLFFSIVFWASAKFIDKKQPRVVMAASVGALMAIGITSVYDFEILYPLISNILFIMGFLVLFTLLASSDNLLGKHKGWAVIIAFLIAYLAFNFINIFSLGPTAAGGTTTTTTPGATGAPTTGGWTLTGEKTEFNVKETDTYKTKGLPKGVDVTWSSSDESVATVGRDSGLVTAVAPGTADIIATGSDKSSATVTITVKAAGKGGGAPPAGLIAKDYGDKITERLTQVPPDINGANNFIKQFEAYAATNPSDPKLQDIKDFIDRLKSTGALQAQSTTSGSSSPSSPSNPSGTSAPQNPSGTAGT